MKRPARDLLVTRRADPAVTTYYGCPNGRCPIRHWPIEIGDRCPKCDTQGYVKGTVAKRVPEPQPGVDDGEDDG